MKLAQPFYRLPMRFDAERLSIEAEQFADSEWRRHPTGYAGNSAVRLISIDGGENDGFGEGMLPTAQLQRCPYIRQILCHFGVVWSRSRLMKLDAHASVPEHVDINYHWAHRVRIHIPIITNPAVTFRCGESTVNMQAGDAWIFDNWRRHTVHNGSGEKRIHLVADTVGDARFWQMIEAGQSPDILAGWPRTAEYLPFRQNVDVQPTCERFSLAKVMSPAEVESLTFDLLSDLRASTNSEDGMVAGRFYQLALKFSRQWRATWAMYGDTPEGWPRYAALQAGVEAEIRKLPLVVFCASNGASALEVFFARILKYSFNPEAGLARQDLNRVSSNAVGNKPAAQQFNRPVFIVAAPRSGSSLLFETLAQAEDLYSLKGEAHWLVEKDPRLRPTSPGVDSNRLLASHIDDSIREQIYSMLSERLRSRNNQAIAGDSPRFLEKTPKNALRIPFFNALFPDARFVFLWRDPRENISSIIEAWRSGGWITYADLPGLAGPWSLLLPPGWEHFKGDPKPIEEIAAFQWKRTNEIILEDLANLSCDRWMSVNYADFTADPAGTVGKICEFADVRVDSALSEYLSRPLPYSTHTLSAPDKDKWRRNAAQIERVLPGLQELYAQLSQL